MIEKLISRRWISRVELARGVGAVTLSQNLGQCEIATILLRCDSYAIWL